MTQHYLYAIVDRLPGRWRPPTAGIAGAPVVPSRVEDLIVLGSLLDCVPPPSPRTLALHQDVVATVVNAGATLPFAYGTAVPASRLPDWVAEHRAEVRAALAAVRGCVEMSIKLLRLDRGVDRHRAGRGAATAHPEPAGELQALAEALVERAALSDWRYRPAGRADNVAAAIAFLVPRGEVPAFLARIAPVASHAGGVAVVPTGPWVPYSFVPDLGGAPLARAGSAAFQSAGLRAG